MEKILIIGAGAAGICAGYVLHTQGIDFQLLEASDRVGGRLGKLEGFATYPLDTGAQWLHGKKSLIGKLIKQTQTDITKDKSKERYWFQQSLVKQPPIDVWELFEQEGLPDVSYAAYAAQQGLGGEYQHIVEAVAGDFWAAADDLSAYWKIKEEEDWSSGGKDYKFAQTYFDLIDTHLAEPIRAHIRLNTVVSEIDYSQEHVIVKGREGQTYTADKVLVTASTIC